MTQTGGSVVDDDQDPPALFGKGRQHASVQERTILQAGGDVLAGHCWWHSRPAPAVIGAGAVVVALVHELLGK